MNRHGFTLIELLVVVLIIGVLSAIALPMYDRAVARSHAAEALAVGKSMWQAEEAFYLSTGEYTDDMQLLDVQFPAEAEYTAHEEGHPGPRVFLNYFDVSVRKHNPHRMLVFRSGNGRKKRQSIYYEIIFGTEGVFCRVRDNNERGQGFCQSLGGKNPSYVSEWIDYEL